MKEVSGLRGIPYPGGAGQQRNGGYEIRAKKLG